MPSVGVGELMASLLAHEIIRLRIRIEAGEDVDQAEVERLVSRVHGEAALLCRGDLVELAGAVDGLMAALDDARNRIHDELKQSKSTRKAMNGYGHLRATKTEQRLFRKA